MPRTPAENAFPLSLIIIYVVLAVLSMLLSVFGAMRMAESLGLVLLGAGLIGFLLTGASLPLAILLASRAGAPERRQDSASLAGRPVEQLLHQLQENSMLSDNAKRVLFRERELELMRGAIEEDIQRGDYNAGLTLCDEMANLFGHREEAEAFRSRILQAGHASYEAQVRQALAHLDQVVTSHDWNRAYAEAARIRRLYPASELVQDVDQRIIRAREQHKHDLESQFVDAANRDDVEHAMLLLKQLDRYLTREEAGRLSAVAQNVVVKHRDNLGTQFKLAVNDHRWAEAAQVGDLIIEQFPNTKMADEVRSLIDTLRVRASHAAVAAEV